MLLFGHQMSERRKVPITLRHTALHWHFALFGSRATGAVGHCGFLFKGSRQQSSPHLLVIIYGEGKLVHNVMNIITTPRRSSCSWSFRLIPLAKKLCNAAFKGPFAEFLYGYLLWIVFRNCVGRDSFLNSLQRGNVKIFELLERLQDFCRFHKIFLHSKKSRVIKRVTQYLCVKMCVARF